MSVRDAKNKQAVELGAPERGHQPAFDDDWSGIDIPDIINSRLDPSAREKRHQTRAWPPNQRVRYDDYLDPASKEQLRIFHEQMEWQRRHSNGPNRKSKHKRKGPRQKGDFNSRRGRIVTKADDNYSKAHPSQRYRKVKRKNDIEWEFIGGMIFFTMPVWGWPVAIGLICLYQYIF